jgi:malonyl-CoA O-methyltransferase
MSMVDTPKQRIKTQFNRAAECYDQYNQLQRAVGNALIRHLLTAGKTASSVIDLGCGTGVVTEALANAIPAIRIDAIDIADKLLAAAKHRLSGFNVNISLADFESFNACDQYDLVFSNMALHWAADFPSLLRRIYSALTADGLLAFTVPVAGTFSDLKKQLPRVSGQAFFNPFIEIKTLNDNLETAGFSMLTEDVQDYCYPYTNILSALMSLKHVGSTGLVGDERHRSSGSLLTSIGRDALLDTRKKIEVDYRIAVIVARRAA